jgi:2-hydroxy-6-oxonona-2,4-dienedioate hydrolase
VRYASALADRSEQRSADPFRSIATQVGETAMHAVVANDGGNASDMATLVLVHGLGLSQRYMMPVARELARDYRVYVPDLPGFGGSGHPEEGLDMTGLADALAAWMTALGIARATLLGNSQGCQVIGQLAVRHHALVDRLVLQGPTCPPEERNWLWQFIRWRQNGPYNPRSLDPVTWGEYKKSGYLRVLRTFQHALNDRLEDHVHKIAVPTAVVRGEHDPICRQGWARRLVSLLPNGRLMEIPGVAHTLCYTAPTELAEVTRNFLRDSAAVPNQPPR